MQKTLEQPIISKKTKLITWLTNYNNKLKCDSFIHVDIAPPNTLTWQKIEESNYQIETLDNSHPPVIVELLDIQIFPFHKIPNWYTYTSHGINEEEFAQMMFKKYQNFSWDTQTALYLYKKVFL